jgi:small ligand-binding sensory domain FIST
MRLLSPVDFNKLGATNFKFDTLSSAPGSPVEGQAYHNTTDHLFYVHNGTLFVPGGGYHTHFDFSYPGTVATGTGAGRLYNDTGRAMTIIAIRASVGTAPTGATLIVDVNKNGTTVFTTQGNRPAIAISGNTAKVTNMDVTALADGDYLTVDVDQVGSTVAGANLTVAVWCK